MRKKCAVQMNNQSVHGKDSISAINFLTKFKRACDSLRILERATVYRFREFMKGSVLAATKPWVTLPSNDSGRHERLIRIYAEVVNHLLRHYATDGLMEKTDEEI